MRKKDPKLRTSSREQRTTTRISGRLTEMAMAQELEAGKDEEAAEAAASPAEELLGRKSNKS